MSYDLKLERRIDSPVGEVFRAFTEPAELAKWYRPVAEWETSGVELDLRVGGRYKVSFGPSDERFTETGEYLEIAPESRLVYTMEFTGPDSSFETIVKVEFFEDGDGTRLVINEQGYPTEEIRDRHSSGWGRFLDNLDSSLRS